ncbi:MAG: ABC transporter permease subunit [Algibacter sp.]
MLRLLNLEFLKLKHNKASIVLITIYFILLTLIALIAIIKFDIGPIKFHLAEMGIFNFPYIWHFNTFVAAFLKVFLLLVIVSMVANEYSNKTLKQNLIDGLSKKEFILSKFYMIILLSAISTVFVFIVSLILGLVYSTYTEVSIVFTDFEFLIAFFVKLLGFFSLGLFFGVLIKRSAFAVAGIIVFFLVEFFSYVAVSVSYAGNKNVADDIFQFTPFKSMWNLIDEPGSRLSAVKALAEQVGEDLSYDYAVHWYEIVIVLGWTAIFVFSSYKLLKKRDL